MIIFQLFLQIGNQSFLQIFSEDNSNAVLDYQSDQRGTLIRLYMHSARHSVDNTSKMTEKVSIHFSKIIQKCCLKAILPFIIGKKEWIKPLARLNKIIFISHSQSKLKQKRFICPRCKRLYESVLLYLIHLELIHFNQIQIQKYEMDRDHLTIKFNEEPTKQVKQFYFVEKGYYGLQDLLEQRISHVLKNIVKKMQRMPNKKDIVYYHSGPSVFEPIGSSSENEDSQAELSNLEKELQKVKINDIIDINQTDKQFFIKWNETVHKVMQGSWVIDRRVTLNTLDQFLIVAKNEGIRRVHLVMHLWTLWSSDRITTHDIIQVLVKFDKLMQQ